MQYTGLDDKNGVMIFEGDILELDENEAKYIGGNRRYVVVGKKSGSFMYGRNDVDPSHLNTPLRMFGWGKDGPEVVGNVFENHLLLFTENALFI